MPDYDFHQLSPIDFEDFSRDLMQADMGLRFESFKPGADLGIDFRYAVSNSDNSIIVQCKHYRVSGITALLSDLRRKELPKIKKLAPSRYLLVTSLPLSPSGKDKLFKLLRPYVISTSDIYGKEDLNNLLGIHSHIEKSWIKLWCNSAAVLEEILNRETRNLSQLEIEKIKERSSLYVRNDSFPQASKILSTQNVCVIAGVPGIGKTTLAEMLLIDAISQSYRVVKISSNAREALSVTTKDQKTIFYYDDFLGQTSRGEKLGKNEDQLLLDLIHAVRKSKSNKLILTTREYVLEQARQEYEKIEREDFLPNLCIIDLSQYTRMIRAQILFNHLFFSRLDNAYKQALLRSNRALLKIIDHDNYSPRIIEFVTESHRLHDVKPKEYPKHILEILNNPSHIWKAAFERHLSDHAKYILLTIVSMPRLVLVERLKEAYEKLSGALGLGLDRDFKDGLRELDGTFVSIEKIKDDHYIQLHNPSVRDFLEAKLKNEPRLAVMLAEKALYWEQTAWFWKKDKDLQSVLAKSVGYVEAIKKSLSCSSCSVFKGQSFDGKAFLFEIPIEYVKRADLYLEVLLKSSRDCSREISRINQSILDRFDSDHVNRSDLVYYLITLQEGGDFSDAEHSSFLSSSKDYLFSSLCEGDELDSLSMLFTELSEHLTDDDRKRARVVFEDTVHELISMLTDDDKDVLEEIEWNITSVAETIGSDVSVEVARIQEIKNRLVEMEEEQPYESRSLTEEIEEPSHSDKEVLSIFTPLIDEVPPTPEEKFIRTILGV